MCSPNCYSGQKELRKATCMWGFQCNLQQMCRFVSVSNTKILLAKDCQQYFTTNTHVGMCAFTRFPSGIHSGQAMFQQILDSVLAGIQHVICYLDDILVAGIDKEDHLHTLSVVFQKLLDAGFSSEQIQVQGTAVVCGILSSCDRCKRTSSYWREDACHAPPPKDVSALKPFLGLMMLYSRFLPHHLKCFSSLKQITEEWRAMEMDHSGAECILWCKEAVTGVQHYLVLYLVHYNDSLSLLLPCDASSYGAREVLCHPIDGQYWPIAFTTVTLTGAQKNYSQLDKAAFSIICGLKRFHQFLATNVLP